uniref:Metalloendopeptidase n=1 Tax=Engraulis japonicus TaxID=42892 RepID=B5UA88_ENGJA|nr:hatching enzyme [Engraulis japonicus]
MGGKLASILALALLLSISHSAHVGDKNDRHETNESSDISSRILNAHKATYGLEDELLHEQSRPDQDQHVKIHGEYVSTEETNESSDISSRILEANKDISDHLMEGDVALPRTRNAMRCLYYDCKWPKSRSGLVEVPYNISDYYYASEKRTIERAMAALHEKTCVRFVPHTNQLHYLSIESKTGCWSLVGRIGGKQRVSLNAFSCLQNGIVQHELLHALGFYHEHTRSDRDQYVRINWEHVSAGAISNFKKRDTNNLDTPYDYSSVMHYGRYADSTSRLHPTITPIPDASMEIGQRNELSEIDILKINKLYKCGGLQ